MGIVDRVKNICLTPKTEWPVIAAESASTGGLISGYVAPLVALGAVAGFIGGSIVGRSMLFVGGTYRVPIATGLGLAVFTVVMGIVGVFVLSLIINALAPTFGGQKDSLQAFKVAAYSYTPGWVAGVLQILPSLGMLAVLGSLYGLYLLYLGLPVLMKSPQDKAVGYTAVVVVCAIVLTIVIGSVGALVVGAGALGSGLLGSPTASSAPSGDVTFDKDSPLGKLQQFGQAMEESNKKMEAAQKSGDTNAQASAAMETLGTLFGGGRRVDPLEIDQIKTFVPATFAGLPKEGTGTAEKTGIAGLMISRAEARYGQGNSKAATLEIQDSGGASGLMGLASWATIQSSKEDENGSEKTSTVNGRMVHEKRTKNGGDEYSIVLGNRFIVTAKSNDLNLDDLKAGVSALDLNKLEGMKDVGVKK